MNCCVLNEVFDLLATLDTTTANGQDGISARMLKSVAASITPSLTKLFNVSKLFNMSLMTGCTEAAPAFQKWSGHCN